MPIFPGVRLHREAIEIHKHQQSLNKKQEGLKLNKAWLLALKNTPCKKVNKLYPDSTQPQGPVITAHKRLANNTHQSQWQIISPHYYKNTPTTNNTQLPQSPNLLKRTKSWSHSYKYSTIPQTAPEHRQSSDSCLLKMPATETGEKLGRKTSRTQSDSPNNLQQPLNPDCESLQEYKKNQTFSHLCVVTLGRKGFRT